MYSNRDRTRYTWVRNDERISSCIHIIIFFFPTLRLAPTIRSWSPEAQVSRVSLTLVRKPWSVLVHGEMWGNYGRRDTESERERERRIYSGNKLGEHHWSKYEPAAKLFCACGCAHHTRKLRLDSQRLRLAGSVIREVYLRTHSCTASNIHTLPVYA